MDSTHKLEKTIGGWLKPLPHLPTEWRKWIAKNIWWITLVGVVLSIVGVFGLLAAASLFSATSGFYGTVVYNSILQTHGGLWLFAIYISIALLILTIVVEVMAISPLKELKKKGWDLLFLAYLISIAWGVISAILNIDISSLISAVISAVIGAYLLFEIKSHFK